MPTLTESNRALECVVSEASGTRSRETVTLLTTGAGTAPVLSCTVLGKVTASGKYKQVTTSGSDGGQTAVAVLLYTEDASGGDVQGVILARDAEVNGAELIYPAGADASAIAAINTALAAVGIIVRAGLTGTV